MCQGQDAYHYPHFIDEKAEFPSETGSVGWEFYVKPARMVLSTRTATQPSKQTVVTLWSPTLPLPWVECRCKSYFQRLEYKVKFRKPWL